MHRMASSESIGFELLRMLGLQTDNVRAVTITLEVGCLAIVTTETYVTERSNDGELDTILKKYELTEITTDGKQPDFSVEPPVVIHTQG